MGYYRRFKLSDYTADECRKKLHAIEQRIASKEKILGHTLVELLDEYGCFRELLARHENQNQSQLDKKG